MFAVQELYRRVKSKVTFGGCALPLVLFVVTSVAGCATCRPVSLLKVTAEKHTTEIGIKEELDKIVYRVGPYASMSFFPCDGRRGTVCMSIRVAEGQKAKLVDTAFTLTDRINGKTFRFSIEQLSYTVSCRIAKNGEKTCSSSEEPPVVGKIQMHEILRSPRSGNDTYIRSYSYSFDATEEFEGSIAKEGVPYIRLFDAAANWRSYRATIVQDSVLGSNFTLSIPALSVSGSQYRIPDILLETVNEEVCYRPELI